MKKLTCTFLLSLAFCAGPVYADATMRMVTRDATVILRPEPCTDKKTLSIIEEQYRPMFRAADVIWRGKSLKGCWMALPEKGVVIMADETGDHGALPMSAFRPSAGI